MDFLTLTAEEKEKVENKVKYGFFRVTDFLGDISRGVAKLDTDPPEKETELLGRLVHYNDMITDIAQKLDYAYQHTRELVADFSEAEVAYAQSLISAKHSELLNEAVKIQEKIDAIYKEVYDKSKDLSHVSVSDIDSVFEADAHLEEDFKADSDSTYLEATKNTAMFMDAATDAGVHLPEDALENNPTRKDQVFEFGQTIIETHNHFNDINLLREELNEMRKHIYEKPEGPERQAANLEWLEALKRYKAAYEGTITIEQALTGVKNAIKDAYEVNKTEVAIKLEQHKIDKADRKRVIEMLPQVRDSKLKADMAFLKYNVLRFLREGEYSKADSFAHLNYVKEADRTSKSDQYVRIFFARVPIKSKEMEADFYERNPFDDWKKANEKYIDVIENVEQTYSNRMQECLNTVKKENDFIIETSKELNEIIERNPISEKFLSDTIGNRLMNQSIATVAPLADSPYYIEETVFNDHTDKKERTFVRNDKTKDDEGR